eukprot:3516240-Prymnesium_polylepis.1
MVEDVARAQRFDSAALNQGSSAAIRLRGFESVVDGQGRLKTVFPSRVGPSGMSIHRHGWKKVASGHGTPPTLAVTLAMYAQLVVAMALHACASSHGSVGQGSRSTLHSRAASH